jgi:hypothetical protein
MVATGRPLVKAPRISPLSIGGRLRCHSTKNGYKTRIKIQDISTAKIRNLSHGMVNRVYDGSPTTTVLISGEVAKQSTGYRSCHALVWPHCQTLAARTPVPIMPKRYPIQCPIHLALEGGKMRRMDASMLIRVELRIEI